MSYHVPMPEAVANGTRFASLQEVAEILGVKAKRVRHYVATGYRLAQVGKPARLVKLQATRLPKTIAFRGIDIARFIASINTETQVAELTRNPLPIRTLAIDAPLAAPAQVGSYPTHLENESTSPARVARRSAPRANVGNARDGGSRATERATG